MRLAGVRIDDCPIQKQPIAKCIEIGEEKPSPVKRANKNNEKKTKQKNQRSSKHDEKKIRTSKKRLSKKKRKVPFRAWVAKIFGDMYA